LLPRGALRARRRGSRGSRRCLGCQLSGGGLRGWACSAAGAAQVVHQNCVLQLRVQLPVAAALQAILLVGVRIVAVEGVGIAHCRQAGNRRCWLAAVQVRGRGSGWAAGCRRWYRQRCTHGKMLLPCPAPRPAPPPALLSPLSFSCVSLMVLPSGFFLQVCPSRRKKRQTRRSNRKSWPPAGGEPRTPGG
jgi:hypothetical protein